MICPHCTTLNETDALYCIECGAPLADQPRQSTHSQTRPYWYALLLIPVVLVAVAAGYYKFFLPQGIAAEVNGEAILLSDLEAAVARVPGSNGRSAGKVRRQVLDELITERLLLQEARKAGITVAKAELSAAVDATRASSGLDDAAFTKIVASRYGGMSAFEDKLARRLRIKKILDDRIAPRDVEPHVAQLAIDRWYKTVRQSASVRIAPASLGGFGSNGGCNREAGTVSPCCCGSKAARGEGKKEAGSDSSSKTE